MQLNTRGAGGASHRNQGQTNMLASPRRCSAARPLRPPHPHRLARRLAACLGAAGAPAFAPARPAPGPPPRGAAPPATLPSPPPLPPGMNLMSTPDGEPPVSLMSLASSPRPSSHNTSVEKTPHSDSDHSLSSTLSSSCKIRLAFNRIIST